MALYASKFKITQSGNSRLNLSLVLKRSRRGGRQLATLTLAICLVTGFFALSPLYIRAMVQSGLQYEIGRLEENDRTLTLISPTPFAPSAWEMVNRYLGDLNGGLTRIARSGSAFGGFDYLYGEPTTELSGRSAYANHVYAFSNLTQLVRVVKGRFPERLAPPSDPARTATSEQDAVDKGLGMYSVGEVEAVITPTVAKKSGYELGTRFAIGESSASRVVVVVVGIVEPMNPNDPIWETNRRALEGEEIEIGLTDRAYQVGFMVTEGAYTDWVAQATTTNRRENNNYVWLINLVPEAITADNILDTQSQMRELVARLAAEYPGLTDFNPVLRTLNAYIGLVGAAEPTVILLSGAVLVMMLFHLVTTVSLILEQQREEWAALASRGASAFQLVLLQALTMFILCLIGFGVGPFLALLILHLLLIGSPLVAATGGALPIGGIPSHAFALSGIAAAAALVMLTWPAFSAARRSLTQFKQIVARPPEKPLWARYGFDLILILVGLGFIARLLFFIEGDLGSTLGLLFSNPGALINLLLDSATRLGGLADPLNLLGPALLLTGIALLWLRFFPSLMRLLGAPLRQGRGLTAPLSAWTVERDPGHYAQLVLLLIGTLALGTAALALSATRDAGTWKQAQFETGGTARLDLDPFSGGATDQTVWAQLPGVTGAASVISYQSAQRAGYTQYALAGIDPTQVGAIFPALQETVFPLTTAEVISRHDFNRRSRKVEQIIIYPVILSEKMAVEEGRAFRQDRLPLKVGNEAVLDLLLPDNTRHPIYYYVVGIVRDFPSLGADQEFMILNAHHLLAAVNSNLTLAPQYRALPNQVWLELSTREPSQALIESLNGVQGVTHLVYAWDRFNELLREPLPAAVAGMLFAGFWVSLILSLLDFGFYLAVTAKRRSLGFAVLQALGWNGQRIWAQLVAEQTVLVIPALIVGVILGGALAYVILPFLRLLGGVTLILPPGNLAALLLTLLAGFGALTLGAAWWLRRLNINRVLRLGEE